MKIEPDPGLERERLVLETLEEALSWPPAERTARLEVRFAQNPALLAEILELLRAAESADQSLPTALPMAAAVGAVFASATASARLALRPRSDRSIARAAR